MDNEIPDPKLVNQLIKAEKLLKRSQRKIHRICDFPSYDAAMEKIVREFSELIERVKGEEPAAANKTKKKSQSEELDQEMLEKDSPEQISETKDDDDDDDDDGDATLPAKNTNVCDDEAEITNKEMDNGEPAAVPAKKKRSLSEELERKRRIKARMQGEPAAAPAKKKRSPSEELESKRRFKARMQEMKRTTHFVPPPDRPPPSFRSRNPKQHEFFQNLAQFAVDEKFNKTSQTKLMVVEVLEVRLSIIHDIHYPMTFIVEAAGGCDSRTFKATVAVHRSGGIKGVVSCKEV